MRSIISITTRIRRCSRRAAAWVLLCVLLGCIGAQAQYLDDDALHLGVISVASQQTNPFIPEEREFMSLTSLMYEGLMRIDDDFRPQPCLAERYKNSANGRTWYFYLRQDATFHDGTQVTAYDVVASAEEILRLAKEEKRGYYASLQYFITSITASDGLTVAVNTNRANYGFLFAMTFPVLKASEVQQPNPLGSGAYYLDLFVPGDYMLLSAYRNWWQNVPDYDQIMVTFHAANRELISSFEYSRVDGILTRAITAAQYRGGVSTYNIGYRTRQLELLMMNNSVRELNDPRVRRAIRYLVDLDDIVNNVYYGMVTRTDTPLIPGTWTYWDQDNQVVNTQKALSLLDEAGWTDSDDDGIRDRMVEGKQQNLVVRLFVYEEQDNSVRVETANRIADSLVRAGIGCNVTTMTFADARDRLRASNYDLCITAFNMDVVPDPGFLLISGNTANYMRYRSTEMDKLFDTLRSSVDEQQYADTLMRIQALYWEDCPFISLWWRDGAILSRKMFTDARDVREPEILRGIETFSLY